MAVACVAAAAVFGAVEFGGRREKLNTECCVRWKESVSSCSESEVPVDDLLEILPGPDFPTGAIIRGKVGIVDTYMTGRGRVIMEAATDIEEIRGNREQIIVSELPYQVNKANLVEKIPGVPVNV